MKATKKMKAIWFLKLNRPAPPKPFKGSQGRRVCSLQAKPRLPSPHLAPGFPQAPAQRPPVRILAHNKSERRGPAGKAGFVAKVAEL